MIGIYLTAGFIGSPENLFVFGIFSGNPAAVVPLEHWLPGEWMQQIEAENNLAETVFYVPVERGFEWRWFTPKVEVDLCGHATLGAAHVLFHHLNFQGPSVSFQSRSGRLNVFREHDWLTLDCPAEVQVETMGEQIRECLNECAHVETLKGKLDFMSVLSSKEAVENIPPDFYRVNNLGGRGWMVTAPGSGGQAVTDLEGWKQIPDHT